MDPESVVKLVQKRRRLWRKPVFLQILAVLSKPMALANQGQDFHYGVN
jgi:hypothetical protein